MIRDTLLVIDDSELDLAILNEIFKHHFRVECAQNAHRGFTCLKENRERICAVLLDICLERRGAGFTVLNQLQVERDTVDLPVILITTDANEKDVRASVERGAADFLVKPVDPHTVQERVCAVVRQAWPPNSTILDHVPEEEPLQTSDGRKRTLLCADMTVKEAEPLVQRWLKKLELVCQFRSMPALKHQRQLGALTACLASRYEKMHPEGPLTKKDAAWIGLAAPFCDIGLLGLPDPAGAQEEGDPRHTTLGYELLSFEEEEVPLLRYGAEIALWHHRNADGSGWPQDMEGEPPLSAALVHTALRIQHHLHYFQGYEDALERTIRTMASEVGSIITKEMYEVLIGSEQSLRELLRNQVK